MGVTAARVRDHDRVCHHQRHSRSTMSVATTRTNWPIQKCGVMPNRELHEKMRPPDGSTMNRAPKLNTNARSQARPRGTSPSARRRL